MKIFEGNIIKKNTKYSSIQLFNKILYENPLNCNEIQMKNNNENCSFFFYSLTFLVVVDGVFMLPCIFYFFLFGSS